MATVIKNKGKEVEAWELGTGSEKEQQMIAEGRIIAHDDGTYELFSQEAVNGSGEIAQTGDYFKVDGSGYPYPQNREWFKENHTLVEGDTYEQKPVALEAYRVGENMPDAIQFLIEEGKLEINEDDPKHYFNAELWGAKESAGQDATVIIYGTTQDENGNITDVDFNFVAKDEFDATYHDVDEPEIYSGFTKEEAATIMFEIGNSYMDSYYAIKAFDTAVDKMEGLSDIEHVQDFDKARIEADKALKSDTQARACAEALQEFLATGQTEMEGKDENIIEIAFTESDTATRFTSPSYHTDDIKEALSDFKECAYDRVEPVRESSEFSDILNAANNFASEMSEIRMDSVRDFGIPTFIRVDSDRDFGFPTFVKEKDVSTQKAGQSVHIGIQKIMNGFEVKVSPVGNVKYLGVDIEAQKFDNLEDAEKAYEETVADWGNNDKQSEFENCVKWNLSSHDLSEFGIEGNSEKISGTQSIEPYETTVMPFGKVNIERESKVASPFGGTVDVALIHIPDDNIIGEQWRVQVNPITTDGKVCHDNLRPIETRYFDSREEALDFFREQVEDWNYHNNSQKFIDTAERLENGKNDFGIEEIKLSRPSLPESDTPDLSDDEVSIDD